MRGGFLFSANALENLEKPTSRTSIMHKPAASGKTGFSAKMLSLVLLAIRLRQMKGNTTDSIQKVGTSKTSTGTNKMDPGDRAIHDWYRFVLSFPPHLVQNYISEFGLGNKSVLLDPFCGTGTTLVVAKFHNISSVGIEANPFAHFASSVKVDWDVDPDSLVCESINVAKNANRILRKQGLDGNLPFEGDTSGLSLRKLEPQEEDLLLTNSISPIPLHKTLVLLKCLEKAKTQRIYHHQLLALASAIVYDVSNLRFGPEVGVGKIKLDAPVVSAWLNKVRSMADDLSRHIIEHHANSRVVLADARQIDTVLPPCSIDAVITSPPYPNEKDYTRTTRLESVILGLISGKEELRALKKSLIRSNTRNVFKGDDDDSWISNHPEILEISDAIERRRIELGKTSGFERLYPKVTRLYFGGMYRHLAALQHVLRPGAHLAYVVGDQSSYLRVMIRTGQLLAKIARNLGYEVVRFDLFRNRFSTATKEQLREEVLILRWHGKNGHDI